MSGIGLGKGERARVAYRFSVRVKVSFTVRANSYVYFADCGRICLFDRYSVDDAEYKSHLGKEFAVPSGLIGPTKHRLLINHF